MKKYRGAADTSDEMNRRPPSQKLMAVIERDLRTGRLVGQVLGVSAAQTQEQSIDEVRTSLAEVIDLLRQQGAIKLERAFIALIRL